LGIDFGALLSSLLSLVALSGEESRLVESSTSSSYFRGDSLFFGCFFDYSTLENVEIADVLGCGTRRLDNPILFILPVDTRPLVS